jgi:hypothetical protein
MGRSRSNTTAASRSSEPRAVRYVSLLDLALEALGLVRALLMAGAGGARNRAITVRDVPALRQHQQHGGADRCPSPISSVRRDEVQTARAEYWREARRTSKAGIDCPRHIPPGERSEHFIETLPGFAEWRLCDFWRETKRRLDARV